MRISREFAISELRNVVDNVELWIAELKNPKFIHMAQDGSKEEKFCYDQADNGEPLIEPFISINEMEEINVNQLRSELICLAHKLESLATS